MNQKKSGPTQLPLHVVQIGWDTALLQRAAASDSAERQKLYASLLRERRPGSRMTILVLGADRNDMPPAIDGLDVIPVVGRWKSLLWLPWLLRRLDAEMPISVLAPQSPLEEGWMALAWARRRIPVVAQLHFDILSDHARPDGSRIRRFLGATRQRQALRLLPSYAAVRTVAPDMAAKLAAIGARNVRSIPVPIVDLSVLLDVGSRSISKPDRRILFVGRLAPEKNLDLWLSVAGLVANSLPDVHFDIVGDGPRKAALEARANELGLAERVVFHGAMTRNALPAAIQNASAFLLTSDHEGFGRVLVEAMAAGVPVVSTRTAGALEVLADGNAGLMADIGDAHGLAQAIVQVLSDTPFRERLIAAGRRRILDRYRPLELAAQWVDMLIEATERQ